MNGRRSRPWEEEALLRAILVSNRRSRSFHKKGERRDILGTETRLPNLRPCSGQRKAPLISQNRNVRVGQCPGKIGGVMHLTRILIPAIFLALMPFSSQGEAPFNFEKTKAAADHGDPEAEFLVGRAYYKGEGAARDLTQALNYFQKSAEQNCPKAIHGLGVMYASGQGVPKDAAKGAEWFRKAALQGYAPSAYNLGQIYAKGTGVKADMAEALKWFNQAAEQGSVEAQVELAHRYMLGEGVNKDDAIAAKWTLKAAETGNPWAQNALGSLYEHGRGLPQDYRKALDFYSKSAEQGFAKAQSNLGRIYAEGIGLDRDYFKAFVWFTLSAEQEEMTAVNSLPDVEMHLTKAQIQQGRVAASDFKKRHPKTSASQLHCSSRREAASS